MTERNKIFKLVSEAEVSYFAYRRACEKIETFLSEKNPEENIEDVIYQPGDGICVVCMGEGFNTLVPNNIPVERYVKGDRV